MSEADKQAVFSRRSLTTLLGAAGAAALAACASRASADETTGTISAADTLAGGLPSMAALRALAVTAGMSYAVVQGYTVTRLTGSGTLGFRIDASTPGASLIGNRIDPGGTFDYVLMSDRRMAGNIGKVTTFNGSTYFAEDQGRHTLAPSTSPPVSAPAGTAFAAGDIVYHAAPVTGGNLGWVWTGAAGWKPFGTIG